MVQSGFSAAKGTVSQRLIAGLSGAAPEFAGAGLGAGIFAAAGQNPLTGANFGLLAGGFSKAVVMFRAGARGTQQAVQAAEEVTQGNPPRTGAGSAEQTIGPRAIPSELTELRSPRRPLLEHEGDLITGAQRLQSRVTGTFESVVQGVHPQPANKYLWTIDQRGINLASESTLWPTPRGNIVHTNLSSKASIAGEAWFGPGNEVTINAGSGRFGFGSGASEAQWNAAVKLWEGLGYKVKAIPFSQR